MFYLVIFIIGFVITVVALCCIAICVKERFYIELYMSIAFFAVGVIMAICGATSFNRIYHKPKETFIAPIEYPAPKFDLKLKVIEFDGKRDTAYVFVFFEGPRSFTKEHLASEYELKLRIVEFEGQRDTTYVLVEKIKENEICQ